jgi:molybdate/tungstate transport system substrate-binding protein
LQQIMKPRYPLTLWVIVALLAISGGCTSPKEKTPLKVLFAGSLITPFDALEKAFEAKHPDIDVLMEGHGSIQVVRHVTDIHDLVDVAATADYALIPLLMYSSRVPETEQPYADWYIKFATNKLALAYTPQSHYADEVNAANWYEVLARPDVTLGLADPRFDAAGYRGLMVLKLAEAIYGEPTLFVDLTLGRFKPPITIAEENGRAIIHVPELVTPKPDSGILMRGASIQLIALLESGDLDYAFEYESVIQQHGLEMVRLPDALNLGADACADQYGQVQVRLDFQRFASVKPEFNGEVIGYGITIPANAPHPKQAVEFLAFLLGPEGQAVMEANDHPLIIHPEADRYDALPEALKSLCVPGPQTP